MICHQPFIVSILVVLALAPAGNASGQVVVGAVPIAGSQGLECRFELGANVDRVDYDVPVSTPGPVRAQAAWTGGAESVALMVSVVRPDRALARVTGASPLSLAFEVRDDDLAGRSSLRISVLSVGQRAVGQGWVLVEAPRPPSPPVLIGALSGNPPAAIREPVGAVPQLPVLELAPVVGPTIPPSRGCAHPSVGAATAGADTIRTVLPDGRVETRYPDGEIRRQSIDSSCWEVINPGGQTMILCPHTNVIRTQLADLPPELLTDAELSVWLEDLGPHLLDAIRQIIADPAGLSNYLAFEGGRPLPERIDLRLRLLNRLLERQ